MKSRASKTVDRRQFLALTGGALLFGGTASAANAFPPRLVTIMCGYQAGGIVDTTSRRLAQHLSIAWGNSVIVDNRPGANGNIAAGLVAHAEPDGGTVLVTLYDGLIIAGAGKLDVGFDPIRDLAPVALIGDVEDWFLVNSSSPFKTMAEFLDYAKKNPGKISFGSIGVGSSGHLGLEQINAQTGAGLVHVPYKGVSMLVDLIAGHIDAVFSSRLSTAGYVKEGKLRVLAVTGDRRSPLLPDVPSFSEVGLGTILVPYALGAFVSVKTPDAIVTRLNQDIIKALHEPAVQDRFASEGIPVGDLSPQAFKSRVQREVGIMAEVIAKNHVTLE
jgi:tripartite-type tricarboxylate transporter receptor subunit TctC